MRSFSQYWLTGLILVVLGVNVVVALYVGSLRDDVKQSLVSSNVGCKRANVQRDAVRFLLEGRIHDSQLVSATSSNAEIAAYFKSQIEGAQMKLDGLLASAAKTFPLKEDPYLVDCDKQYPLP